MKQENGCVPRTIAWEIRELERAESKKSEPGGGEGEKNWGRKRDKNKEDTEKGQGCRQSPQDPTTEKISVCLVQIQEKGHPLKAPGLRAGGSR